MKLQLAKKLGNVFKSNLNKISKERQQVNEQKSTLKILNCFTNQKKLLLNYLMIILQLYLRLNTKKFMEKEFQFCQHEYLAVRSLTIEISKY